MQAERRPKVVSHLRLLFVFIKRLDTRIFLKYTKLLSYSFHFFALYCSLRNHLLLHIRPLVTKIPFTHILTTLILAP